jgi:hypothetical protein
MSTPEDPDMNAESTHIELPRMDLGCEMNSVLSFTVGALSATTVCAIGYLLYTWFARG